MADHAGVKEIFALTKDIDNCFGHSEGQILFRAVAGQLGKTAMGLPRVGGTRKAGALAGVPARLVAHFKNICVALEARLTWRRTKRSGRFTLESLAETSRRLREVSFVVLLLSFQDMSEPIGRHIALVQGSAEPWLVRAADQECLRETDEILMSLETAERFLCVCYLLAQWSGASDRGRFFD